MKEIEIKILEIDVDKIREQITHLGAEKTFDGNVPIVTLDYPDNRLDNTGEMLRVRKIGDTVELCYKGKNESSQFKTKEEIQVTTSNFDETVQLFEKLGFIISHKGNKHRESYTLGNIKFEIDTYDEIPTFLEIEAPTEQEVAEYVKKLGYTLDQTTNMTADQLIHHYQNSKK